MSTHPVTIVDNLAQGITGLRDEVTAAIRAPDSVTLNGTDVVYAFTPDLTGPEQAALVALVRARRSRVPLTRAERDALEPALADLRAFRTQSAAEFSALTAAQRDAALRTALFGVIDVLRALLRD